ncbi:MAG: TAXI family TRAP transporter solute-binding subunit [Burkholderiales bacterium]
MPPRLAPLAFRPLSWARTLPWRAFLTIGVPVVLGVAVSIWLAARYLQPAPPKRIVFAAGPEGSAYRAMAERYRTLLARDGITVDIRTTAGSRENYRLLRDRKEPVDLAFVRAGIGDKEEAPHLVSLGVTGYEALWVFCQGKHTRDDLPGLNGKTIAIGAKGAGTRRLVRTLLAANGIDERDFKAVEIGGTDAAEALLSGQVDCAFLFEPPEAGVLKALIYSPQSQLVDFSRRADAYGKRIPALHKVVLPEGANDLESNRPDRPVTLLAAQTQLVAQDELHSAVQMLVMQAGAEVHGEPDVFHEEHEFPAARAVEFPLSDDAKRYFTQGRPFLQRYLPFWVANIVDRALVFLIPVLAIVLPLVRILPPLYAWSVRRRIFRWYGELMFIENEMRRTLTRGETRDFGARLDWIEREVNELETPVAFANVLYALRQHIDFVQHKLERMAAGASPETGEPALPPPMAPMQDA